MISIIVPVYHIEMYLCQCIEGILAQIYKQFELLLIGDESRDTSGEICHKYFTIGSCICIYKIMHSGSSVARNKGWEKDESGKK